MTKKNPPRRRGFTLLELLVVLVILGLLASLVGPQVLKQLSGSKTKTAALQINELRSAVELFRLEVGRYPSNNEGLQALVERPPGATDWNGPYLTKKVLRKDPWGNDYHYRFPGEHGDFDIWSLGADNKEGGDGENQDVVSWE
ncbi:type II secretion system major pseudopilin GspG [Gallaecimonas kandeliae]|uniref:type II secretion system major pseudopilin GspG n=1 Tax=Gallaecimonas kandeliae TaxID=3029055 RepID=UPI0026492CA8|nr:type II secretion system major pseudopilin GspG [Gallaecimonas kandeliae]WKE65671.1 type II secretion system major pseudopilin GspG [Gallaecimonas kandeliae]